MFGKPEEPSFLWWSDFWTCPWLPKPILFISGDARILQIFQETSRIIFQKYCLRNSQHFGNRFFNMEQRGEGPTNTEDPFNICLKILNMGSRSPRKHEMEIIAAPRSQSDLLSLCLIKGGSGIHSQLLIGWVPALRQERTDPPFLFPLISCHPPN